MKFAIKLANWMKNNEINKYQLAKKIEVSPSMINKYLYLGVMPGYATANRISKITSNYISAEEIAAEAIKRIDNEKA